jgi:hypothetical protein
MVRHQLTQTHGTTHRRQLQQHQLLRLLPLMRGLTLVYQMAHLPLVKKNLSKNS